MLPSSTTIEVTMGSTATGSATAGPSGTVTLDFYYVIGPLIQTYGYGWGTNTFEWNYNSYYFYNFKRSLA